MSAKRLTTWAARSDVPAAAVPQTAKRAPYENRHGTWQRGISQQRLMNSKLPAVISIWSRTVLPP